MRTEASSRFLILSLIIVRNSFSLTTSFSSNLLRSSITGTGGCSASMAAILLRRVLFLLLRAPSSLFKAEFFLSKNENNNKIFATI